MKNARSTEQRATWWLAVPAGVALLAAGVVAGRTSVRPATPSVPDEEEGAPRTADDRRFQVLEQEISRLRIAVARTPRADADEPVEVERKLDDAKAADAEPTDPVEAERVLAAARAEFLDGLSDRLDTEPVDARWRYETEPVISRLLPEKLGAGVQVSDVSCGSSMCRAKVTHSGSPRLSENRLADFMLQRESLGTMQVQLDTREEGVTTLYFVRSEG